MGVDSLKFVVCDVDGVLTDGGLFLDGDGKGEQKRFDSRDGAAIKTLMRAGIDVGILTGRSSALVERRAYELGINYIVQGAKKKGDDFLALLERTGFKAGECGFIGDDLVDIPAMRIAGWAAAPSNARPLVKSYADYVCLNEGGHGALAEVVEYLLRKLGRWRSAIGRYVD